MAKFDEKAFKENLDKKLSSGQFQKDMPEEKGAEEGDWTNYMFPLKGGTAKVLKSVAGKMTMPAAKAMQKDKRPPKPTDMSKKDVNEKSLDYGKISKEPTAAQAQRNIKPIELKYEKGTPSIKPAKDKPVAPAPVAEKKVTEVKYVIGIDKDGNKIYQK